MILIFQKRDNVHCRIVKQSSGLLNLVTLQPSCYIGKVMFHGPNIGVVHYAYINRIILGHDSVEGYAKGSRNKIYP